MTNKKTQEMQHDTANATPLDEEGLPFFFKRKIRLTASESKYVQSCIADTRRALVQAQRDYDKFKFNYLLDDSRIWDLRNGLTLYLVVLSEIAAGRTLRYLASLKPSVCMAAFLGHDRMLRILERSGVPIPTLNWSTLNVLFAAILGRRFRIVKRLLSDYPQLRESNNIWYGNAGAFCAGFGNLKTLRFLRESEIDLRATYRYKRQPESDPRRYGAPLVNAMREHRRAMVADLLAHGDFLPWQSLFVGELTTSAFREAVRHGFPEVAELYLRNGWFERPGDEEAFWDFARCSGVTDNLCSLRIVEHLFPQFDIKRMVRERESDGWLPDSIRRYCGAGPAKPDPMDNNHSESVGSICNDVQYWAEQNRLNMVRYMLNEAPEILPIVWPKLHDAIRMAFVETSDDVRPCCRYLFRLARSHGIELFVNDDARRFWEKRAEKPSSNTPLTIDEVFPYDEGIEGGYFHEKELREKLYQAIYARGKSARRLMDDPQINPNVYLSWNSPFFAHLGDHADWATYKGWLLRGMRVYWENCDDPGCLELGRTPSIVRHLLPELEHRPWTAWSFNGNTLRRAAETGDIPAAKAILDAGCPVNFDWMGAGDELSPLRAALLNGHDAMARFLYARGGLNILNGIILPLPRWIEKPRSRNTKSIGPSTDGEASGKEN